MEDINKDIQAFLNVDYGSGSGYGYGSGEGYGYSSGLGDGYGYGYSSGLGDGYDSGSGDGYSSGLGDGYGSGDSSGSGDGYGCGDCYDYSDIKAYAGRAVYEIDGIPTIIDRVVRGRYAQGIVIDRDLTLKPCYIAKVGNFFAHGDTLRDAVRNAAEKYNENRPVEERIAEFVKTHPELNTPYGDLFSWHHTLTGSCEFGREQWCKAHGLKRDDSITVREFIQGTVNDYGGDVIRKLAEAYGVNLK